MLHETDADRQRESAIAERIARAWRCELQKLGRISPIDYAIKRDGRVAGWLEIKTQNKTEDQLRAWGILIDVEKMVAAHSFAIVTGLPVFIAVNTLAGLYYSRVGPHLAPEAVKICGRSDRGDPRDTSPACAYPFELFKLIPCEKAMAS